MVFEWMSQNIFGQVLTESRLQLGPYCILIRHSYITSDTSASLCMQEWQADA